MALSYGFSTSHRVDCGSGSTVDNISSGTLLMLAYFDDVSTFAYLASKLTGSVGWEYHKRAVAPDSLRFALYKGGSQAAIISTSFLAATTWTWVAVTWATNGAGAMTGAIYSAPIDGVFTDRTSSVSGGAGTQDDDSAASLLIGNTSALNGSFGGDIACVQLHTAVLTAAELAAARDYVLPSMLSRWEFGYTSAAGVENDYGRGQNTGTVTGATVVNHPNVVVRFGRRAGWMDASVSAAASGGGPVLSDGRAFGRGRIFGGSALRHHAHEYGRVA